MLRITNLLRGRLPKHIPMRAGIPNWDRPDPPPTVRYNLDHQVLISRLSYLILKLYSILEMVVSHSFS